MSHVAALLGRLLLGVLFIASGTTKLLQPAQTDAFIQSAGLPAGLAMPVGALEVIAGVAIALGFMTRITSVILAVGMILSALWFYRDLNDADAASHFVKNIGIAGGLLCLFAHSQMRWSYDSMRLRRKGELATRDAEARAHDAELRAARAEGRAEVVGSTPMAATRHDEPAPSTRRKWF